MTPFWRPSQSLNFQRLCVSWEYSLFKSTHVVQETARKSNFIPCSIDPPCYKKQRLTYIYNLQYDKIKGHTFVLLFLLY
jgi:hypothetical protein